jgi:hypothetical protein
LSIRATVNKPQNIENAKARTIVGAHCGTALSVDIGFEVDSRPYTVPLVGSCSVKKSTAMNEGFGLL